jgi:hypothetical protein
MQKGLVSVHSVLTIGSHVVTYVNILVLETSCVFLVCVMGRFCCFCCCCCCCVMIVQSQVGGICCVNV